MWILGVSLFLLSWFGCIASTHRRHLVAAAAVSTLVGTVLPTFMAMFYLLRRRRRRRGRIQNHPSSKTTQYYEKLAEREISWFRKHLRASPDMLDRLAERLTPVFHEQFGVLHHNTQFNIKHRIAVTLNFFVVGDAGQAASTLCMSRATALRSLKQIEACLVRIRPDVIFLPKVIQSLL